MVTTRTETLSSMQYRTTAEARYATVSLNAGFMPDPHEVRVEAGGDMDASAAQLGPECIGWIDPSRADVTLTYTAGQFPLYISAASQADTTLVVTPDWLGVPPSVGGSRAWGFAAQLYSAIAFGLPLRTAFDQAALQVQLSLGAGSGEPRLYVADGLDADEICLVHPASSEDPV